MEAVMEKPVDLSNVPDMVSSAILGSISISVWEGWKRDKDTAEKNRKDKGAKSKRANSATKNLFSDCDLLEAIKSERSASRQWFNKTTIDWADSWRMIPMKRYLEIRDEAELRKQRFDHLCEKFYIYYPQEISKQAFANGGFFNRDEYPTVGELRRKFAFRFDIMPLPISGDFRVDVGEEMKQEIARRYEVEMESRIKNALSTTWDRVKVRVLHIQERMDAVLEYEPGQVEEEPILNEDGTLKELKIISKRRPKLHESLLEQGLETCAILSDLNITNDPRLEEARKMLENALVSLDIKSLRSSPELQSSVKTKMQAICDKFDF